MVETGSFHENLERDLQRLSSEIKEQRARPEGSALSEREIVKRSLQSFATPISPVSSPSQGDESPLPSYLQSSGTDPKVKLEIEKLIDLVFHESLEKAVKEARRHPPFIEDSFHDALVDKLLPELKKRGAI